MSFYSLTVKDDAAREPASLIARFADEAGLAGLLMMGVALGALMFASVL